MLPSCCCCCCSPDWAGCDCSGDGGWDGDAGASPRASSWRCSKVLCEMQSRTSRPSSCATDGPVYIGVDAWDGEGVSTGRVGQSSFHRPPHTTRHDKSTTYNPRPASNLDTCASAAPLLLDSKAWPGVACPEDAPPPQGFPNPASRLGLPGVGHQKAGEAVVARARAGQGKARHRQQLRRLRLLVVRLPAFIVPPLFVRGCGWCGWCKTRVGLRIVQSAMRER